VTAVLVILVTLGFFGLSWFTTQTMLSPESAGTSDGVIATPPKGEVSARIVVAMVLGLVALLILGIHPPAALTHLLEQAANQLGAPR
jgi:hydrogenase-4 component F